MSVQEVWFAQSPYSNANSNDENLTCTSVYDSHLGQNTQGVNQNIIHYVDMMFFWVFLQPPHLPTHFFKWMWSLCWSLSLGCAITHPVWLAGPCSVPGAPGAFTAHLCVEQDLICPELQFSVLSLYLLMDWSSSTKHENISLSSLQTHT